MNKKQQKSKTKKVSALNILQAFFEVFVILGYGIGFIPFGYLISMFWVIPLTLINLIISHKKQNGTQKFTKINFVMSLLSIIPGVGFLFRIAGVVMSIVSLVALSKTLNKRFQKMSLTNQLLTIIAIGSLSHHRR